MNRLIKSLLLVFVVATSQVNAQTDQFRVSELNPYFSEFLKPMTTSLSVGMGQGWVHTAKPHKMLGFDLKLSAAVVQIPSSALSFDGSALSSMINNDNYSLLKNGAAITPEGANIPTIASEDASAYALKKTIGSGGGVAVDMPLLDGVSVPYGGNLALQLSVGLPKGTEVMGRFIPDMAERINSAANISEASVTTLNMWGVGVKHDLKQWIPVVHRIPIMQLSAYVAYSQFDFGIQANGLNLDPADMIKGGSVNIKYEGAAGDAGVWNKQGFDLSMQSLTGAVMAGLNIPIIKPYVGIGFNRASVSTGLTGNLPEIEYVDDSNVNVRIDQEGLRIKNQETFVNLQAGINIKLAVINIHAQYTYQEYSMISGGIAIGFR